MSATSQTNESSSQIFGPRIELYFHNSGANIFLQRTKFFNPLRNSVTISTRGLELNYRSNGTFGWGSGVRALSAFLMHQKLNANSIGNESLFSGGSASLPATLDAVMSKQPTWFLEMFGEDRLGKSLFHRFVARENPQRKRPGPVRISLLKSSTFSIQIFANEKQIQEPHDLRAMLDLLYINYRPALSTKTRSISEPENSRDFIFQLKQEASRSLSVISNLSKFRKCSQEFIYSPTFRSIAGLRTSSIISSRFEKNLVSLNSDITSDVYLLYSMKKPITYATSYYSIGEQVIIRYLSKYLKAPVFLNCSHRCSLDLFRSLNEQNAKEIDYPDFVSLGLGAIAGVEREKKIPYVPFLPLPPISAGFITRKIQKRRNSVCGDLLVDMDDFSSSSMFIKDLIKSKTISKKQITLVNGSEYSELQRSSGLSESESIYFTHFPLVDLNIFINDFTFLSELYLRLGVLSHKDSLKSRPHLIAAFSRLFLYSWKKIAAEPQLLLTLVKEIWTSEQYREDFYSFSSGTDVFGNA